MSAGTRVVKRYANRKLYDTEEKRYVTLEQVAVLIREGAEIKVVDNESGEDLTSVTLSQILVEQEKKREGGLPKTFLNDLVKSSSTFFDYLRKTLGSWLSAANISEEAIGHNIDELVKKGQLTIEEGARLRRDIIDRTRDYLAKMDETIEKRVGAALAAVSIPTKNDLDQLRERMQKLVERYEKAIAEIEAKAGTGAGASAGSPGSSAPNGAGLGSGSSGNSGSSAPANAGSSASAGAPKS